MIDHLTFLIQKRPKKSPDWAYLNVAMSVNKYSYFSARSINENQEFLVKADNICYSIFEKSVMSLLE